tara:strand:+ start:73 stop:306 length:234 start_codon:yes stop_codon:yes gene_type:complete
MNLDNFIDNFKEQFDDSESLRLFPETNFKELDEWDSIVALSIIAMVDAEYGIKLTAKEINNSITVDDLFFLLESKHS